MMYLNNTPKTMIMIQVKYTITTMVKDIKHAKVDIKYNQIIDNKPNPQNNTGIFKVEMISISDKYKLDIENAKKQGIEICDALVSMDKNGTATFGLIDKKTKRLVSRVGILIKLKRNIKVSEYVII